MHDYFVFVMKILWGIAQKVVVYCRKLLTTAEKNSGTTECRMTGCCKLQYTQRSVSVQHNVSILTGVSQSIF